MSSPRDTDIRVIPAEGTAGAAVSFPYDASLVARFRADFPRARWNEAESAWFIPGVTAVRRAVTWLHRELPSGLARADERGRDAFAFEPIESEYLQADRDLVVRTPYSQSVIEQLRNVPWAAWRPEDRAWHIPYRSLEALKGRWPEIEAAAHRAEPGERAVRRARMRSSPEYAETREREVERRRRRYPVPRSEMPPFGRPFMTTIGLILFTSTDGEVVDFASVPAMYQISGRFPEYVWFCWRRPSLDELVRLWPARRPIEEAERAKGWWQPSLEDLRAARRKTRSRERGRATRIRKTS